MNSRLVRLVNNARLESSSSDSALIFWILRIGVAGCFIGHGAFGVITKAAWVPYFAVAGIGESMAWPLMPMVGWMDIAIGVLALAWPCRALFVWAALWATWTALLRPLAGESVFEFLERAGNYGVPLAILAVIGTQGSFFRRATDIWPEFAEANRGRLILALRLTTVVLLVGHAGLGLFVQKAGLADHYAALGFSNPEAVVPFVGAMEFFLVAIVLLIPRPGLFIAVCIWKIATESLFVVAGAPFWEVIERFGSYAAPFALATLLWKARPQADMEPAAA